MLGEARVEAPGMVVGEDVVVAERRLMQLPHHQVSLLQRATRSAVWACCLVFCAILRLHC